MQKIKDNFIKFDDIFTQIIRNGNIAIYERTRKDDGTVSGYEVIKIKIASRDNNKIGYKAGDELYPSNSDFGVYAWMYMSHQKDKAFKKFEELINNNH